MTPADALDLQGSELFQMGSHSLTHVSVARIAEENRIEEIAEKSGDTPAQIYANLQKSERLEALEREITERKVFDFLKEKSEITDN